MTKRTIIYFFFCLISLHFSYSKDEILKFNHITIDDGLSQNLISSIVKDKYGFMWFGTWEGACRYDGYTFKVFRADEDDITALSNNRINSIIIDSKKDIWISTSDYKFVFKFNYDTETFSRFAFNKVSKTILQNLKDVRKKNSIASTESFSWEKSNYGLIQTNKKTKEKFLYKTNKENPFSISDNCISAIYLDDCENLWIGTHNGGISYTNLRNKPFNYYSEQRNGNGLSNNVVRAICQEKSGKLWVGTESHGITVIGGKPNKPIFTQFNKDKLIDPNIRSIYCDKFNFVWIGTKGGLDKFDPQTGKFKHYFANKSGGLPHPWVFTIMEDHNGYLWIGTFDGIAKYDRNNDRFLCYDPQKTLKSEKVRVIFEDSKYNLWVGTEGGGITRLTRDSSCGFIEKLSPTHFQHIPENENSLTNNLVLAITEDIDHKLWIGTNSGLCRFDYKKGDFKRFSVKNGFRDDLIMGLLSDGRNHIWVSHKRGLTRMDIHTFETLEYNNQDGLQGNEFTQNAYYRNSKSGELFFGGTNGLNSFYPNQIPINRYKLLPILTSLKVMNQTVEIGSKINNRIILSKSLACISKITLSWWDKNFTLEFSALNYTNPKTSKFKYILEGFDHQCTYTDATCRSVSYSHIPSGTYTFKVYAANSDGIWNNSPASVQIEILPPWWLSWWAKTIYSFLFCLLVLLVYKYIANRIEYRNSLLREKLKNEKNEELALLKLQFFTEISHEFRTPLTLIIDPLERLLTESLSNEKIHYYHSLMHRNAKQLLTLINQLLDFRKLESGKHHLNPVSSDLILFIRNTAASFESCALENNIHFTVKSSADQLFVDFDIDKMSKIINNLISNALKFTDKNGKVSITISETTTQPTKVLIQICDTGIGIAPEKLDQVFEIFFQAENSVSQKEGSGIGLALTKELVLLHHGEIFVESNIGQGSCFSIVIPLKQDRPASKPTTELIEDERIRDQISSEISDNISLANENNDLPLLLIVDDNADIRHYIQNNFAENYRIIIAADGKDGFMKATESIPDIIISDIMMPQISGIEMCRMLKKNELTSHIPIVLLTARQSNESKVEGYETGADAYLTKPFSIVVLRAQLSNLLEQRKRLRQLFSNGSELEVKRIAINDTDEIFLKKVIKLISDNIEDINFDPDILAEKLKMSRSQLYRKIKAMTNQTVHDFITTLRMNKALEFLLSGEYSISEVAYKVGYSLPTNFTRSFVKQFGETPSKYIEASK